MEVPRKRLWNRFLLDAAFDVEDFGFDSSFVNSWDCRGERYGIRAGRSRCLVVFCHLGDCLVRGLSVGYGLTGRLCHGISRLERLLPELQFKVRKAAAEDSAF